MSWKKNADGTWTERSDSKNDIDWGDDEPFKDFDDGKVVPMNSSVALSSSYSKSSSSSKEWKKCAWSHPPYEVAPGVVIYGGSCGSPIVKDADVYGGFDAYSMELQEDYPWSSKKGPVQFMFRISDMQPPKDPVEFKNMIVWLAEQLGEGKKVHIGCIGGHGRTGVVLAALRKHMTGDDDASQHVRDNYCKKAIESSSQVQFLEEHWGIKPVKPNKTYSYSSSSKGGKSGKGGQKEFTFNDMMKGGSGYGFGGSKTGPKDKHPAERTGQPLKTAASIWGDE
jgi:hypothetical protein